jgi:iron complex transport system substrate-binding protein
MKRKFVPVLLALAMMFTLVACSSPAPAPESASSASASATTTKAAHYPVTITTYNFAGDEVTTTYEQAPEKVLAVYQGSVETMIALGLEDHVIAAYGLDNKVKPEWQTALDKMNYDDSVFAPDRETVIALDPDMIFSWGSYFGEKKLGDVDYWINSGTNTYINTNTRPGTHPRTLENEYTDILNIGKIFDVEDQAKAIVDEMKSAVSAAKAKASGKEPQSVAIIEFGEKIVNYGTSQLGGNMATALGAKLAIPDATSVGTEDLIAADPDAIFVVYMADRGDTPGEDVRQTQLDKVLKDPSLASLKAVQNGRVYPIMLGDMYAAAVRSIDGIDTLSQGIYPVA